MKQCELIPKRMRYNQLIKQYGKVWNILEEKVSVQCFNGESGVLIQSLCGGYRRWVKREEVWI